MRISGGDARGTVLDIPRGDAVRPATDGLRQAVFSVLAGRLAGARFADLFAGSGAYGLEAWSRGAAGGVFVEQSPRVLACLRANVAAVAKSARRDPAEVLVRQGDALVWRPDPAEPPPDLVFVDPPYSRISDIAPEIFATLRETVPAEVDLLVVFEHPGELNLSPEGWVLLRRIGRGARQPTAGVYRRA